ncbi:MAG: tetratricopeptide repeat protein [Termitinemataceae bacterium]
METQKIIIGRQLFYLCMMLFVSSCDTGMIHVFEGTMYVQQNRTNEAIRAFTRASSDPASRFYGRYGLASLYASMGETETAVSMFTALLTDLQDLYKAEPQQYKDLLYRSYYNRGICQYSLQNFSAAAESFRLALQTDSRQWDAKYNLELSLLAHMKKKGSASGAARLDLQKGSSKNQVLLEYIRQKETDRWKSQQWKAGEDTGADY